MKPLLLCICLGGASMVTADDTLTDEAFFEFLGSFDEVDDAWIDPLWMTDETPTDADDEVSVPAKEDPDEG